MSMSILHVHVHVACPCQCCMSMYIYTEMPEWRTVRNPVSPVTDWKKLMIPEQTRYRTKLTQSSIFLVRYRTKIQDAGMPMLALVSSMPMPRYAIQYVLFGRIIVFWAATESEDQWGNLGIRKQYYTSRDLHGGTAGCSQCPQPPCFWDREWPLPPSAPQGTPW
jgi:hypothetical protein